MDSRNELCEFYFHLGLGYSEILLFLAHMHGIVISMRTLKRVFKDRSLYRRRHYTDLLDVAAFIQRHIAENGNQHGYRWMHMLCLQNGMTVSRDTVANINRLLDPEGVSLRLRKRLRRRKYFGRGPDFIWHLDSYDKLKQYGLCINGCVDGFSRLVVWMNAYTTSSDPKVIAGYFMEAVQKRKACPWLIRGDMGTENGHVAQMQVFMTGRETSFLYGRSTSNQRIEMFWNFLRRECCQYWIDVLSTLRDCGQFTGDFIDISVIQFCFLKLLQRDIDDMVQVWNTYLIRNSKKQNCPHGRPIMMYTIPDMYATHNYQSVVEDDVIEICQTECVFRRKYPCDKDIFDICVLYMTEMGGDIPDSVEEGLQLYYALRNRLLADL